MGDMTLRSSEVVAQTVRFFRTRRGWTQGQLADALEAEGLDVGRTGVGKIETGARNVSVDELMVLAVTLGVPPVSLLIPQSAEPVALTGTVEVSGDRLAAWVTGARPLDDSDEAVDLFFAGRRQSPEQRDLAQDLARVEGMLADVSENFERLMVTFQTPSSAGRRRSRSVKG
jgi:transcriptional regulator with XRE-family HTH domain